MTRPYRGARCGWAIVLGLAAIGLSTQAVSAATFRWTTAADGDFHDPSNWTLVFGAGTAPPDVNDHAILDGVGAYTVAFFADEGPFASDRLTVGAGDVVFDLFDAINAPYNLTTGSAIADVAGGNLTLDGLDMNVGDKLQVRNGSTLTVTANSDFVTQNMLIGAAVGDGTVLVDGPLATFAVTGTDIQLIAGGQNGSLTFDNRAIGFIGGTINLAVSDVTSKTGTLAVEGGANLFIASLNAGGLGSTAVINVTGTNSVLSQSGASTLTLGGASAGTALVSVRDNSSFATGTGGVMVNNTSSVSIGDPALPGGTFTANGPMTIRSAVVLNDGGALVANHDVTVDGGIIVENAAAGAVTFGAGRTVTVQNNGTLNLQEHTINDDTALDLNTGSTLSVTGNLFVGSSTAGSLLVDNATLDVSSQTFVRGGGTLTVQNGADANMNKL